MEVEKSWDSLKVGVVAVRIMVSPISFAIVCRPHRMTSAVIGSTSRIVNTPSYVAEIS